MTHLKIGLVGTYSNSNIGDYLLVECAKELLQQHFDGASVKIIDIDPHDPAFYTGRRKLNFKVFKLLKKHKDNPLFQSPLVRYCYGYFMNLIKVNWHYREQVKDIDCLIFAGGGFIKFKTQGLNYPDEQILKIAQKRQIPVMFNAVGVEGYDESDIRCRQLKKALNFDVVKVITTRDDLSTLQNKYITRDDIITDRVGDTVFWLQECFPDRKDPSAKAIGINLINPDNFITYGGHAEYSQIESFYKDLINELIRQDVDYYLFTNGMKVDHKFGKRLIAQMKLPKDKLLKRPANSKEFLRQMSQFNAILSARMHAGIVAYAMNIPRVGLIWSEKINFFSELIGERATYFNEDEMNAKKIASLLSKADKLESSTKKSKKLKENTLYHLKNFVNVVEKSKVDK